MTDKTDDTSTEAVPGDIVALLKRCAKALKPFAGKVRNDNGDMTVRDVPYLDGDACINAYFVHEAVSRALTADQPAPETSHQWPVRPTGSNADEWALYISELGQVNSAYLAVQIADAIDDALRAQAGEEAPND